MRIKRIRIGTYKLEFKSFVPAKTILNTAALRGVQHNNQWCHVILENESVESDLFNKSKKLVWEYYDTTSLHSVTFNHRRI